MQKTTIHSYYMGAAIIDNRHNLNGEEPWFAETINGVDIHSGTIGGGVLAELKQRIKQFHINNRTIYAKRLQARCKHINFEDRMDGGICLDCGLIYEVDD